MFRVVVVPLLTTRYSVFIEINLTIMNKKITINIEKVIFGNTDDSLLSALNNNHIFIPSSCSGKGTCGFCKCKVLSGDDLILPSEKPFLTQSEIENKIRLACRVNVTRDMAVNIPEHNFLIRKFQTRVEKVTDLTYDMKELTLRLIQPEKIEFKAGQYIQLITPIYEKSHRSVTRAYSIASSPVYDDQIKLIIRLVPEGICTTYVFEYLKEGDKLDFTGPFGDFIIQDTNADMLFIAGGSGKAPMKSMIEYLNKMGSKRRMVYFFGVRTKRDLYMTEMFYDFEKKFSDFTFVPILSNPDKDEIWYGRTGYIPNYFGEYIKDAENTEAYLCGSPGMLAAVTKKLKEHGVSRDKIYFDSY